MTLYADVKHTGQVVEAEEDGILETGVCDIPYTVGELIFFPIVGDPFIVTEGWIAGNHIPVERKVKPKQRELSPFEEQYYEQMYKQSWVGDEDENYIDKERWNL